MRLPPGARSMSGTDLLVLEALIGGARTVRATADAAGVPLTTTHAVLVRLRLLDLIAWEDGKAGTLRPLVRPATR